MAKQHLPPGVSVLSGKTTRESSCNALPLAYHNSSHFVSNAESINRETIMDKIVADGFSFALVLLCCFSAFIANLIHSCYKFSPSAKCDWFLAGIIGPVEKLNCPFPFPNSVLRILISSYLFCCLLIVVLLMHCKSCTCLSLTRCISCLMTVLSVSHYLCFISITMDSYAIYTAYKFSQYKLDVSTDEIKITFDGLEDLEGDEGTDASKSGLFTVIITNLLVLVSCATMRYMIKPWYQQLTKEVECASSTASGTKPSHPQVEIRGKVHDAAMEKKLNVIIQSNLDPQAYSNSNSSVECSITRYHSDVDDVNIINVVPNKDTNDEISSMTSNSSRLSPDGSG
eukprot:299177_1